MSKEKPLPKLPSSPLRPRPLMPSRPVRPRRPSQGLFDESTADHVSPHDPFPYDRQSQSSQYSQCGSEGTQRQSLLITQLQAQIFALQSQLEESQRENLKQKRMIDLHNRTLANLCSYITITVSDFQEQQKSFTEAEGEIPIAYTEYNTDIAGSSCNLF